MKNIKIVNVILCTFLLSVNISSSIAHAGTDATKTEFLNQLIKSMTLEEKIGQLTLFTSDMDQTGATIKEDYKKDILSGRVGAIFNAYTPEFTLKLQDLAQKSRLKIPLLFGYDVVHGHRTIFPIPLAEASSWDMKLLEATAKAAAAEASADGIHWTFSPMVDISRDPRWGRVAEGAGEDPFLGSLIAKAKIKGYQGSSLANPESIMACVKHFAFYGAPIAGRDYNSVDMSTRTMFETYLPPYKAAVDAGAASVMTSFNDINGVPATANTWLLQNLLRDIWGFKGFIVTDYTAINELVKHGIAENEKEAGLLAIKAGVDMDMQGAVYYTHLKNLIEENKVSESDIDKNVLRVLEAKYNLGLFQDPYRKVSRERATKVLMNPKILSLSQTMATKSIVLLKDQNQILPLKKDSVVALIGPLVKSKRDVIGNWSAAGDWKNAVSVFEGLAKISDAHSLKLNYELGANIIDDPKLLKRLNDYGANIAIDPRSPEKMISDAVALASQSDVVVAVLGESEAMSGEAASRTDIGIPENQLALLKALKLTGKPIVLVLMNGRPLTLTWENENIDAILETWFLGTNAGNAIANVLTGVANPSGKLTISFPRSIGQIPLFYASKNTGRPIDPNNKYSSKYLDEENTPLYPFGFGLSYSHFSYGEISLNHSSMTKDSPLVASVTVTNDSVYYGEEIVQLYLRDVVASVTRPIIELKDFKKIHLKPNESKTVKFTITNDELKFYNQNMEWVAEPGEFKVFIGTNSRDLKEASFQLK
jgi:beta-glucosidase